MQSLNTGIIDRIYDTIYLVGDYGWFEVGRVIGEMRIQIGGGRGVLEMRARLAEKIIEKGYTLIKKEVDVDWKAVN